MMRLNAPLPALLALAVLYLIPATLLAKPAHHRARKAAAVHHKAAAKPQRTAARRHKAEPRVAPVHARRTRRPLSSTGTTEARASAPRKATSSDFLKAAAVKAVRQDAHEAAAAPAPRRAGRAARARNIEHTEVAASSRSRRTRRSRSVSRPVSVVNVVRPAVEKPQLKSISDEAAAPAILPVLYNKRGRLIVPPPLKGSHEILLHQNEVADREGLERIQNDADLLDMRSKRMLVPLPTSYALQVDERLPVNRRYTRPWTAVFLSSMARAHYAHFHTPLQINSAVRTVEFQQHLIRINGNAAPAEGDTASPHLTGQAVDIAKHGLSRTEIAWMRGYLLPLIQEGKIDVEEEFQQSCFHISVYKRYLPPADAPTRDLASHRSSEASALATAIR